MALLNASSIGRYIFHAILISLSLSGMVLGANSFDDRKERTDFHEKYELQELSGNVLSTGDFSEMPAFSGMLLSESQSIRTEENASGTLHFAGVSLVRLGAKTNVTLQKTHSPTLSLSEGNLWMNTLETITVELPNVDIIATAGAGEITYEDGKATVKAITNALVLRFYDESKKTSFFFLPKGHQVVFLPKSFLSLAEQEQLRFSKLTKELHLSTFSETDEIKKNSEADTVFFEKTKKDFSAYVLRPHEQALLEKEESLFESLALLQKKKEQNVEYRNILKKKEIWSPVVAGKASGVAQKIQAHGASPSEEIRYYSALALFSPSSLPEKKAIFSALQKDNPSIPRPFFDYLLLSSIAGETADLPEENVKELSRQVSERLKNAFQENPKGLDNYALLFSSLLKSYPEKMTNETIAILEFLNTTLIAAETDPYFTTTRRLEITNATFDVITALLEKKSYTLAKQLLESSTKQIENDENPELAILREKMLTQKTEVERRILFHQVSGGGTEEEFQEFAKGLGSEEETGETEEGERNEEFIPIAQAVFQEYNIHTESLIPESDAPHLLKIEMGVNPQNVAFSGLYNADKKIFIGITFLNGSESLVSSDLYTPDQMAKITKDSLLAIATPTPPLKASPSEKEGGVEENTHFLPPEVIELAMGMAQKDFKDIIAVKPMNIRVESSDIVQVSSAKSLLLAPSKPSVPANPPKAKGPISEEFTFSFTYNVKQHVSTTAKIDGTEIVVANPLSPHDLVKTLEDLVSKHRQTEALLESARLQLSSSGFSIQNASFTEGAPREVEFSGIAYQKSFTFSGTYRPDEKIFGKVQESSGKVLGGSSLPLSDLLQQVKLKMLEEKQ